MKSIKLYFILFALFILTLSHENASEPTLVESEFEALKFLADVATYELSAMPQKKKKPIDSDEDDDEDNPFPFKDLKDDKKEPDTDPKKEEEEGSSGWKKAFGAFMDVTNNWKNVVQAFKTTRSSTIKEKLLGQGFKKFSQSATIQISRGIEDSHFQEILGRTIKRLKVPDERSGALESVIQDIPYIRDNMWSAVNTGFSIDNGGKFKFVSILTHKNFKQKEWDLMVTDIDADFFLMPDVWIYEDSLSVLGGIWADTKTREVEKIKGLNTEEVKAIMKFFQIVTFKAFADEYGIDIKWPNMKDN
jgi:hypothetical protein